MSLFSTFDTSGIVAISDCSHGTMKLGSADATHNRDRFFNSIGIAPSSVVSAELVHGNIVEVVTGRHAGQTVVGADGLLTNEPGIFLSITTADCLPIFLFSGANNMLGILHAGRQGISLGIIRSAILLAGEKFSVSPESISVGIGPGICQKHYEVKDDVLEPFTNYHDAVLRDGNKIFLDLKKIAKIQCIEHGILEKNIVVSTVCTYEDKHYFSQRRDRHDPVEAMVSVIGRK